MTFTRPLKKKRTPRGHYFNYFEPSGSDNIPRQTLGLQSLPCAGTSSSSHTPDSDAPSRQSVIRGEHKQVSDETNREEQDLQGRSSHHEREQPLDSDESDDSGDDTDAGDNEIQDPEILTNEIVYDEGIQTLPCIGLCICSRCDFNNDEDEPHEELPTDVSPADDLSQPVRDQSDKCGDVEEGVGAGCAHGWGSGDEGGIGSERKDRWDQKYGWDNPVLPNLQTTKFEAMLMILHIVMRHGMSGPFIEDMLKFVNVLLGEEVIPTTEFIFKKLFAPHISLQFHFYCIECEQYLEKNSLEENVVTCDCGTVNKVHNLNSGNFFVTFSVKQQLEEMFKRPDFKVAQHDVDRIGVITDILDGDVYKRLFAGAGPAANEHTLTLTFNTDGAPVWSGPSGSIWPIIYVVNELDRKVRFKPENVILCGLFYGKKSPNMTTFFTPFVKEMQELAMGGVAKTCEDGKKVVCPVFATTCSVDLIAKCKVQCMKQCNAKFGCGYCLHPNDTVCDDLPPHQGRYSTKSPGYPYPLRTHNQMQADMLKADNLDLTGVLGDGSVNGVKGLSVLLGLPEVDICKIFAIDYMHLLKGVSEKMCEVLFNSKKYVNTVNVVKVSNRLGNMKPPHTMTRFPRSLSNRSDWKAKHWIAFLLYCMLPCVHDMLPERNFKNLCDLVEGLHILLRENIFDEDLEIADRLLQRFLRDFNVLYGDRHMTHNMHLLSHLCLIVKDCGPLWAYSAFPFESCNGYLLKLVAGTSGVVTQICQKYATVAFVSHYFKEHIVSDRVLDYCNGVFSYKYLKKSESYADGRSLGSASAGQFTLDEQLAMNEANVILQNDSYSSYNRVVKDNVVYYSRIYDKPKVFDDTCVKLQDGMYAVVEKFIVVTGYENIWALIKPLRMSEAENDRWVYHIKSCATYMYDPLKCVELGNILYKCILIEDLAHSGRSFVCEVPNQFERD